MAFGGFVRGLHHWGASAMVIVVCLHLLRVVAYASYKPPREMTWVTGVLMLLIVLGFGFTGYLLPWDQKAYWATVVGVKIAGTVPVIGEFVGKVLRGGEEVGAVTLTPVLRPAYDLAAVARFRFGRRTPVFRALLRLGGNT